MVSRSRLCSPLLTDKQTDNIALADVLLCIVHMFKFPWRYRPESVKCHKCLHGDQFHLAHQHITCLVWVTTYWSRIISELSKLGESDKSLKYWVQLYYQ